MMKPAFWIALFVICVFILAGCGLVNETVQSTQGMQYPSSTVMVTPTNTDIYSPILTPTPFDTLEPIHVRETMQPLSNDPMNCPEPCFWGIVPNKTQMDEARAFFSHLGFIPFEGKIENSNRHFYTITHTSDNGLETYVTLFSSSDIVENIKVIPNIGKQKDINRQDWIAYSPETLIKRYGKPSRVDLWLEWGPRFLISINMYFDEDQIIVHYSGYDMIPDRPHSARVCPLTAPFDYVGLWMGEAPPDPPYVGISLEKATSLTMDQFTQLMLGDPQQACFVVNGDVFQ